MHPPSQGSYYHLAKRLLGVEYVKRVEEDEDERDAEKNTGPVFRLLGGVAAVHLALSILQTLRRPPALPLSSSTSPSPHNSSVNESGAINGHRCPLCLDAIGTRGVRIVVPVIIGLPTQWVGKFLQIDFPGGNSNSLWPSGLLDLPTGRPQSNWRVFRLQVIPRKHLPFPNIKLYLRRPVEPHTVIPCRNYCS